MEQSIFTLEKRLARAERRSRVALGMATIGVVGGLTLALANRAHTQTTGQEITAPFRVRDSDGKLLFDVVSLAGGPSVRLYNSDGKVVFGAGSTDGDGFVGLSDRKGQVEATVGSDGRAADGAQGGEVQLYRNNELAAEFAAAPEGGLLSVGRPGTKKWAAQLGEDDRGGLVLVRGQDGKPQVVLETTPKDGGYVCVQNAAGTNVAMVSALGGRGSVLTTESTPRPS